MLDTMSTRDAADYLRLAAFATVLAPLTYYVAWCVYSLYFHPLAKYPGPKLAAVSQLWYVMTWTGGSWPFVLKGLHRRYGHVVRIAPNELSFSSAQSFKDIYGHPSKHRKLFLKSQMFYDLEVSNMAYERDPEKHAAKRKLFASSFSPRALRDQEVVIHQHADLLLEQLERLSAESGHVNVNDAFEWLTFDIMGDLAFGEPFGAVRAAKSHYWVSLLLGAVYGSTAAGLKIRLPILKYLLPFLIPKNAIELYAQHKALTLEKVRRRIEIGDNQDREDFLASVIRNGSLREEELASEAEILLIAGAETSATAMTATLYYLAVHPKSLAKLRAELAASFHSSADITGDTTAPLPYLNAVLEETMRIFPPSPVGPPRVSPGDIVDGVYVPEGVYLSTDIMSLHNDPDNTPSPDSWIPERWTGEYGGKEKPYTVPFSIGPRACIGINLAYMEMRVVLAKIAFSLDWELVGKPASWPDSCRLTQLWKKSPLPLKFSRRKTTGE